MRRIYLLSLAALSFSMTSWAAGPARIAIMSVAGNVWTNLVALPSGSSVHSGDKIATDATAMAVIWSPTAGRIEIRNNSQITLADGSLILQKGVVASEGTAVRLGEFYVRAKHTAPGNTWFVVANRNGKQLIAAHRGDILISHPGAAPLLVPAGSYAMPAGQEEKEHKNQPAKERKKEDKGAAAAGATRSGGWTIGSLSHAKSVALVAGLGAAAVGGTIAGVTLTDDSPSPSR